MSVVPYKMSRSSGVEEEATAQKKAGSLVAEIPQPNASSRVHAARVIGGVVPALRSAVTFRFRFLKPHPLDARSRATMRDAARRSAFGRCGCKDRLWFIRHRPIWP